MMKDGVYIINTSRGGLINSEDLLDALNSGKVGGAGLDVYEHEAGIFFEDRSEDVPEDDVLKLLLADPNVLITAHQAYLTQEALKAIAEVTLQNLSDFFNGKTNENEVKL
jgi:D-lactate dehydrogenase